MQTAKTLELNETNALTLIKEACECQGELNKFYRTFHEFSINNQIIAAIQLKEKGLNLTPLKTYNQWQEQGRQVKKGEKAISLWVPKIYTYKEKTAEENEEQENTDVKSISVLRGFRLLNLWFSYEQTEGENYKELDVPLWDEKKALKELNIEKVPFYSLSGRLGGYAQKRKIAINPMERNKNSVMFHEMAHILLEHKPKDFFSDTEAYSLQEVEAELTSYLCIHILGCEGKEYSRNYIQSYLSHTKLDNKSAKRILDCANTIIKAGEVKQKSLFALAS